MQASYFSPVTAKASVVLPSLTWTETSGNYTSIDGNSKSTKPLIKALADIKPDAETLKEVTRHLKK